MTGVGWLDWIAVVAFAAVTVFSSYRLVFRPRCGAVPEADVLPAHVWPADAVLRDVVPADAFHAVMGLVMTTMFWPDPFGPTVAWPGRVWVALFGALLVWPALVYAQATRPRPAEGAPEAGPRLAGRRAGRRRFVSIRAGYFLASALIMVVAVLGGGHQVAGSGSAGARTPMAAMLPSSPRLHPAADPAINLLRDVAGWPVWPLAGAAFIVYGLWLAVAGHSRPAPERVCTAVMATGMALMAFTL